MESDKNEKKPNKGSQLLRREAEKKKEGGGDDKLEPASVLYERPMEVRSGMQTGSDQLFVEKGLS